MHLKLVSKWIDNQWNKVKTVRDTKWTYLWNLDSSSARMLEVNGMVEPLSLHRILVHLENILSGAPLQNMISDCFRLHRTLIILRSRENSRVQICRASNIQASIIHNYQSEIVQKDPLFFSLVFSKQVLLDTTFQNS